MLSDEAKQDLEWWLGNLNESLDKLFFPASPDLEICSDASLSGWGACCDQAKTRGSWTVEDTAKHINELELLGAFYAVQAFAAHATDISVRLYLDNTTAISYINKWGGTKSVVLSDLALEFAGWCEVRRIHIEAIHLAGTANVVADLESRAKPDASDWMLDKDIFSKIMSIWPVELDLFATMKNAQVPLFVSWRPQPSALATNAFGIQWKSNAAYAFPPFSLILKCLQKIRRDEATIVFVCPVWPGQPWFPLLLELSCDVPRLLPSGPYSLKSALGESHPLVLSNGLRLAAWRLSGRATLCEVFRRSLLIYSWPDDATTRISRINQPGDTGLIGVWEGIWIPYQAI